MSFSWKKYPALQSLVPFAIGILIAMRWSNFISLYGSIGCVLGCMMIVGVFQTRKIAPKHIYRKMFLGILCFVALMSLGMTRFLLYDSENHPDYFYGYLEEKDKAIVKVLEPLVEKEKVYKATVEVQKIIGEEEIKSVEGKSILTFEKSDLVRDVKYGDLLVLNNVFKTVDAPKNPAAFNYKQYLAFQNIYHQAYVKADDWQPLNKREANALLEKVFQVRAYCLEMLTEKVESKNEIAVAAALLLGYKNLLEKEVQNIYANTGAMHVLAVSGLHVGFIWGILLGLFTFLKRLRHGKWIQFMVVIIGIWLFALLTGLAPSVCRAALMFSLISLGRLSKTHISTFNIIGASAFMLLAMNPMLLMQLGFQLSYLAVMGIIYMQPRLFDWWKFENKGVQWFWKLSSVSIAAQIATLPLSIMYFHRFPLYFLLANVIVIPGAAMILYTGLAFLFLAKVPYLGDWLGTFLYWEIGLMNYCLGQLQNLPLASLEGLQMQSLEVMFFYIALVVFLAFCHFKKIRLLHFALVMVICFVGHRGYIHHFQNHQNRLIVYQDKYTTAIDFIQATHTTSFLETKKEEKLARFIDFVIHPSHQQAGIQEKDSLSKTTFQNKTYEYKNLLVQYPFIQFWDKKILLVDKDFGGLAVEENLSLDYIILSQNTTVNLVELLDCVDVEKVIIDDTNYPKKCDKWMDILAERGIACHYVGRDRAFVLEL